MGLPLRHASCSLCITVLSASHPVSTLPFPCSPGSGGHSFLTWVTLTIHQFPNELLIDSAHLGIAATCSHCEVVKPRILGKTENSQVLMWSEEGQASFEFGQGMGLRDRTPV